MNIYGSSLSGPDLQSAANVGLQVNVRLSGFCARGLKACRLWADCKKKKCVAPFVKNVSVVATV